MLNDWRTKVHGKAGKSGKVAARGFHGDYVVTVERDGKTVQQTFSLKPEEEKTAVQVVLP